jgi:hypothetical protein
MWATRLGTSAALFLLVAASASAQVVTVIPNVFADAEGPGSNNSLIRNQDNPRTVQLLWNANQLTSLVGLQITGITYRLSGNLPGGYPLQTTTWADYRVSLGPSVAPNQATETFATNFTAPPTLVRSGAWTVAPFSWPVPIGGVGPSPWGVELTFDRPYLYTGGHLALLVSHPGSNNPDQGNSLLDATVNTSPGFGVDYRMFTGTAFNGTSGTETGFPNVVRLTAAIPEPCSLALGGFAALISLAPRARRRVR